MKVMIPIALGLLTLPGPLADSPPAGAPVHSVTFHLTVKERRGNAPMAGASVTLTARDLDRDERGHASEVPGSSRTIAQATTNTWGYAPLLYAYEDVPPPYSSCRHKVYMMVIEKEGFHSMNVCPEGPLDYEGVTAVDKVKNRTERIRALTTSLRPKG